MKRRSILIFVAFLLVACCCCAATQLVDPHFFCVDSIPANAMLPPRAGEEIECQFPIDGQETTLHILAVDSKEEATFRIADEARVVEPVELVIGYDTWAGGEIMVCQVDGDPEPELVLDGAIHRPYDEGFLDYDEEEERFIHRPWDALPLWFRLASSAQRLRVGIAFLIASFLIWLIDTLGL